MAYKVVRHGQFDLQRVGHVATTAEGYEPTHCQRCNLSYHLWSAQPECRHYPLKVIIR